MSTAAASTAELLRDVRELLSDPERWTQGATARNAEGQEVEHDSPEAVAWDLPGAIGKLAPPSYMDSDPWADSRRLLCGLADAGKRSLSWLNDRRSHAEVLALLDKGIACTDKTL